MRTTSSVLVEFPEPMDRPSVIDALVLRPSSSWRASWIDETTMRLIPERRWRTDARYSITIGTSALLADGRRMELSRALSFTTETAPAVTDFRLHYVEETAADRVRAEAEAQAAANLSLDTTTAPADTTADVSARTTITMGFSVPMLRSDVERHFTISPSVDGDLTWSGNSLVFIPSERLKPGARYGVSVLGAHDERGNRLGGDATFSFTTRSGAQVVKVSPANGAGDVETSQAHLWFSEPMDLETTRAALRIVDASTGAAVAGTSVWNEAGTQLRFAFRSALAGGHTFRISLVDGARDQDGNAVTGSWSFVTKAPPAAAAPAQVSTAPGPTRPSGPPPPSDIQDFALWQINQARARYGFAPLRLDAAITQVATAHAWDMMNYGYFSHTGRDGSRVADRLRRAGIGFSSSGENLCYYNGIGVRATLEWCHSIFMSEPYPGYANHKGNILSPNFSRVGIGIAQSGGRIKIVWDFAG